MTRRKRNHRGSQNRGSQNHGSQKRRPKSNRPGPRQRMPIDDVDPELAARLGRDFFDERGVPLLASAQAACAMAQFVELKYGPCVAVFLVDADGRIQADWLLSHPAKLEHVLAEVSNVEDIVRPGLEMVIVEHGEVPLRRSKLQAHDDAMVAIEKRFAGVFTLRFWVIWDGERVHLSGQQGGPGDAEEDMKRAREAGASVFDLRDEAGRRGFGSVGDGSAAGDARSVGDAGSVGNASVGDAGVGDAGVGRDEWNGPDAA